MIDLWFQKLTLPKLVWALLQGRGSPIRVFAEASTKLAAGALKILNVDVHIFVAEMGIQDENGEVLRYRVEASLSRIANLLCTRIENFNTRLPGEYRDHSDNWMRILRAHFIGHATDPIRYLSYATNYYRTLPDGEPQPEKVIANFSMRFLGRFVANEFVPESKIPFSISAWGSWLTLLFFYPFPGMIGHVLFGALRASIRGKPRQNISPTAISKGIVLEQYHSRILETYPESGHLYWHKFSGIDPDRVVMYCNRATDPINENTQQIISKEGFGWVDGNDPLRHLRFPLLTLFKSFCQLSRFFPYRWTETGVWYWISMFQFSLFLEAYRSFARTNHVRALHQHHEETSRSLLVALAVGMEGGLYFWNRWSIHPFPTARGGSGFADIIFSRGPFEEAIFSSSGYKYKHHLQVGSFWTPPLNQTDYDLAKKIRERLAPSVNLAVTLFDSSFGANSHHTEASVRKFVIDLLTAAQEHSDWGILIKAKSVGTQDILQTPGIEEIVESLTLENRIVILDRTTPVSVAGLAGDATACYSINSAGLFAAMATTEKYLMCDLPGLAHHPMKSGGENTLVFSNTANLVTGLEALQKGDQNIGNFGPWQTQLDPFGDNLGNARIGKVIGGYIKDRDQGIGHDKAVQHSIAEFVAEWGEEYATSWDSEAKNPEHKDWLLSAQKMNFEAFRSSS
jgi:hypothetical protein